MPPKGTSSVNIETKLTGPFWHRHSEVAQISVEAVSLTVDETQSEVERYFARVIKNPTGAYEKAIGKRKQANFGKVLDNGATYGPWLESGRTRGPGGRPRTTRFKGYHVWRNVRRRVARMLRKNADQVMVKIVSRLS